MAAKQTDSWYPGVWFKISTCSNFCCTPTILLQYSRLFPNSNRIFSFLDLPLDLSGHFYRTLWVSVKRMILNFLLIALHLKITFSFVCNFLVMFHCLKLELCCAAFLLCCYAKKPVWLLSFMQFFSLCVLLCFRFIIGHKPWHKGAINISFGLRNSRLRRIYSGRACFDVVRSAYFEDFKYRKKCKKIQTNMIHKLWNT